MEDTVNLVARQYTDWIYPKPVEDMKQAMENGYYEFGVPNMFLPLLWPERRSLDGLRVLIAGCGTNQAAYYAMVLPEAHVLAIDLSLNSLQHVQYLKDKHKIQNLTLQQMSLLDVQQLNRQFDYIVSTGVLHHLADPGKGLRALASVLDPDGMMNIMLYGTQNKRTPTLFT